MDYFSYEWNEYLDEKWFFYVKCPAFFSYENSNSIRCYDGKYEDKLTEEFNKYFNSKKKYVTMYAEFEEKFGSYEIIEINSYDIELQDYIERVNLYSKELSDTICKLVGNEIFKKFENIDFKLLLLGYIDTKNYEIITQYYSRIFNKANAFLSGRFEYYNFLKKYVPISLLDISFHDCKIIEINKSDNNLTLIIEDGYWPYDKIYHLSFISVSADGINEIELYQDIYFNRLYYKNNKYYYYIGMSEYDIYKFECDDIKLDVIKKITS